MQPSAFALATPAASILRLASSVRRWVGTVSGMSAAYPTNPRVDGANRSSTATGMVMMPCVVAWRISSSITLRLGAMP